MLIASHFIGNNADVPWTQQAVKWKPKYKKFCSLEISRKAVSKRSGAMMEKSQGGPKVGPKVGRGGGGTHYSRHGQI